MRKSIAIDLDSTLNNLDVVWMARYNELWDDNLSPKDMKVWDTSTIVKPECGVKIFDILKEPGWFRKLGIKDEYAKEVVQWLSERYDLYVATAYSVTTCVDKVAWLQEHFPWIPERNIMFINNKGLLNTDYLIDDGPHNIEAFKQQGVLVDAPYNQQLKQGYRVTNWKDIFCYFQQEHRVDSVQDAQKKNFLGA